MSLTVRVRILLGFGIVLAILVISSAIGAVLVRQIGSDVDQFGGALASAAQARSIDSGMQKVRIRVNQWLRSLNPDFSKDADNLLDQVNAMVAKATADAQSDKERKILADIDHALRAYIVSWQVVRQSYADEAEIYSGKIDKPSAAILDDLAALRDQAAAQNGADGSRLIGVARDRFVTALVLVQGHRFAQKDTDSKRVSEEIDGVLDALSKARIAGKDPIRAERLKVEEKSIVAWHDAFDQVVQIGTARAARMVSWTKNEGEVMAVDANLLFEDGKAAAALAENSVHTGISDSGAVIKVSAALAVILGSVLSFIVGRSIVGPLRPDHRRPEQPFDRQSPLGGS